MDVKTQSALSAFKTTAAQFNQQDTTSEDLKQVEQELVDAKIGIEFWDIEHDLISETVAYDEDDMPKGVPAKFDEYREVCHLGFAKLNDRWQLAVRYGIEWYALNEFTRDPKSPDFAGFLETSRQALAQASRTVRVKVAASLPDFLEAFDNQVKKYSKDIGE